MTFPGRAIAAGALLAGAACVGSVPVGAQKTGLPGDVRAFIERRDKCDHFRGEDGYDAARAEEIAKALAATCKGSDAELARLRHKYRGQRAARAALAGYSSRIE